MVTNQPVEALPGVAGVRWYEIRRDSAGNYSLYQQGTYAPNDGVHRWMGSVAQDKKGNIALGYSVVNGMNVFPGIRYTGRLAGDPLGQMTLGEGTIINGSGVQTTTNSRWGDYTSMNVDPTRRLHLLVRQRVLSGKRGAASFAASAIASARNDCALADADRQFQIARLPLKDRRRGVFERGPGLREESLNGTARGIGRSQHLAERIVLQILSQQFDVAGATLKC